MSNGLAQISLIGAGIVLKSIGFLSKIELITPSTSVTFIFEIGLPLYSYQYLYAT